MPKVKEANVFFSKISIILSICVCIFSVRSYSYETELLFYHEEIFPKDYYWVLMQSQYQGDSIKTGTQQVLSAIQTLKQIVNEQNEDLHNNDSIVSLSTGNKNAEIFFKSQSCKFFVYFFLEEEAFSHEKLVQNFKEISRYEITLGALDIHISGPFSLHQQVFLRIPSQNKQSLTKIIDRIQTQFKESQNLRIIQIQKGNLNSFSDSKMTQQLYKKNVQQIIDENLLLNSIQKEAERYCQNLNMNLYEVISYYPLIDEELQDLTQQDTGLQQQNAQQNEQISEPTEEMTYDEAYQIIANKKFYDYENVFYEVKAICKGVSKPKKIEQKRTKVKQQKLNKKSKNQDKIKKQLEKLNNKLKNQHKQ